MSLIFKLAIASLNASSKTSPLVLYNAATATNLLSSVRMNSSFVNGRSHQNSLVNEPFQQYATSAAILRAAQRQLSESELEKLKALPKRKQSNPYTLFVQERMVERLKLQQDAKGVKPKVTQLMKELGEEWRNTPMDKKLNYYETAKKNRFENVEKELSVFTSMPKEEAQKLKKDITLTRSNRRKTLARFRLKKKMISLQKPKRPTSPFSLYLATLDRGEAKVTEFAAGASKKWNALPEQDKQVFNDKYQKELIEYKKNLSEWESKMITEGHLDVIRAQTRRSVVKTVAKPKKKTQAKVKRLSKLLGKKKASLLKKVRALAKKQKEVAKKSKAKSDKPKRVKKAKDVAVEADKAQVSAA